MGTRLKLIAHDETEEVELDTMHKRLMTHKIKQEVTNDVNLTEIQNINKETQLKDQNGNTKGDYQPVN